MTNTADTVDLAHRLAPGATDAPAVSAPDRPTLTHGGLRRLIRETVAKMNELGLGRGDRVAIVLPNGPEMATAFLAVAAAASTAPLNPAYRADELDFYLSDIGAKAILVARDEQGLAVEVAERLGIRVLRLLLPDDAPAGSFTIAGDPVGPPATPGLAADADIALLLHTSGTTSRPKLVPLSHANLAASAEHIGATLGLTSADRCLNIMPLFHIHGLIAAVLSSLAAGGSVFCTPGFNALRFFHWLGEAKPSWYTAVPTMHQAILPRAARNADTLAATPLRFIRSSSASLPAQVMAELEATFGCPVIESYGMTEAAHQMASNRLPPGQRKPGSVGAAAGPDVAVMAPDGQLLKPGQTGEIVIRGPNVTAGYEKNPDANASAFAHGWFHTGDQGVLDEDGYLRVTGRLKEIINRGGEKISPLEVDGVLMDHPAVAQVVTFAMPHDKLGEEVAVAIVLREGQSASESDIRGFAAARLADFKVPRKVVILDEIPKGATGKLQRIGLAAKLGLG
ncbi:acyl--CoA ligase [Mesorhizobium sp. M4B.F.Ca.ET.058.02.1.1]|uniref:acyl--CoA ligase n=6 Tax=unclassified Mesorhizobium TaxID=325217 RepID=UPI000F761332|nr:acyl--CoA ligase [Mesorhizobium sp. M4B.F.Ca.ET.058.02.1.1]AZO48536.1 AMP-dependent synthetase [Mesorhizobium sp. M4B.F.Ca.ET.058.02.1.1]RWD15560.1 MAG: AMP-dependent synthetase [Mesorhizobium sp.]RWD56509.1 MAG: AMP-dependent synthetase [Mesorhizobium sp.]